jgi:hypothetical protein
MRILRFPQSVLRLTVLAVLLFALTARADIEIETKILLFRGIPGGFGAAHLLPAEAFPNLYPNITFSPGHPPIPDAPYTLMRTTARADPINGLVKLGGFLGSIYSCVETASGDLTSVRGCFKVMESFGDFLQSLNAVDQYDSRDVTLSYPAYYNFAVLEFSSRSFDGADRLDPPRVGVPDFPTGTIAVQEIVREDYRRVTRVIVDLVRLRHMVGHRRMWHEVPIVIVQREAANDTTFWRLTAGHTVRLRALLSGQPGSADYGGLELGSTREFEARADTRITYEKDHQEISGATLAESSLGRALGMPIVPTVAGASVGLRYRPGRDFRVGANPPYDPGKTYDRVKIEFQVRSRTPLYVGDPRLRASYELASRDGSPLPAALRSRHRRGHHLP